MSANYMFYGLISIVGLVTVGVVFVLFYILKVSCFDRTANNPETLPILSTNGQQISRNSAVGNSTVIRSPILTMQNVVAVPDPRLPSNQLNNYQYHTPTPQHSPPPPYISRNLGPLRPETPPIDPHPTTPPTPNTTTVHPTTPPSSFPDPVSPPPYVHTSPTTPPPKQVAPLRSILKKPTTTPPPNHTPPHPEASAASLLSPTPRATTPPRPTTPPNCSSDIIPHLTTPPSPFFQAVLPTSPEPQPVTSPTPGQAKEQVVCNFQRFPSTTGLKLDTPKDLAAVPVLIHTDSGSDISQPLSRYID